MEDCGQCPGCQARKPFLVRDPMGVKPGELVQIRPLRVWYLQLLPVALFFLGYWLGSAFQWGKPGACMGFVSGLLPAVLYIRRRKYKHTITGYAQMAFVSEKKGDNDLD